MVSGFADDTSQSVGTCNVSSGGQIGYFGPDERKRPSAKIGRQLNWPVSIWHMRPSVGDLDSEGTLA